jgi:hypothetical protein
MDIQSAICPNCGAHITNLQNCEFCGSLLIRLQHQGISIEQAGYKDDSKVFKGLEKALNRNLELQRSTNHTVGITTDIYVEQYGEVKNYCLASVIKGLVTLNGKTFFPAVEGDGNDHLMVVFVFRPDWESGGELRLRKFRNLDIYELFTEEIEWNNGTKCYEYAIDFGNDAKGAAQLLSKVIHEVFSIPYETNLDCYTNNWDDTQKNRARMRGETVTDNNNDDDDKWWINLIAFIIIITIMIIIGVIFSNL